MGVTVLLRRGAVYFGLRDEDDEDLPSTGLDLLCRSLLAQGIGAAGLALIGAAVVIGVLRWDPSAVAAGTATGVVIWGALEYFTAIRPRLPTGALEAAPADAAWERPSAGDRMWLAPRLPLAVPLCFGLAWFADRFGVGSVFVPGQFAGYAAASLLGAWQVRRWEREHCSRVAFRLKDGEEQLLAVAAPRAAIH